MTMPADENPEDCHGEVRELWTIDAIDVLGHKASFVLGSFEWRCGIPMIMAEIGGRFVLIMRFFPQLRQGWIHFQCIFHTDGFPSMSGCFVKRFIHSADMTLAIIGELASGAPGVSCGEYRTASDIWVDADGLARHVVGEIEFVQFYNDRDHVADFVSGTDGGPYDLIRRDTVGLPREDTQEIDATARNPVGFEAVGAKIEQ